MTPFIITKAVLSHHGHAKVIPMTALTSSIIGSTTFLIGFVLSAVIQDFKEGERVVTEVVASMEAMLQVARFTAELKPELNMVKLKSGILSIYQSFGVIMHTGKGLFACLETIEKFQNESVVEVHKLMGNSQAIRFQTELSTISRNVCRVYHIKNASFIPAAYAIVEIMTVINLIAMMILDLTPHGTNLFLYASIVYIFAYMVIFIIQLEDPFGSGYHSDSDVDLFVVRTLQAKLEKSLVQVSE